MQVWGHLRFGALLRYAGIALLFLVAGGGLYLQFGAKAISYVSQFGKNQDTPLIVSDLPTQRATTVLTSSEDWKQTLDSLIAPLGEATPAQQPKMVDELVGLYLKEKIRAGEGGSVDPEAIVQQYLSKKEYYTSTLRFEDSVFHVSSTANVPTYASEFQKIIKEYNDRTAGPAIQSLTAFEKEFDIDALKPIGKIKPDIERALDALLKMEVPPQSLSLHKEATEFLLNQAYFVGQIDNAQGDMVQALTALAQYFETLQNGPTIYSRIMALQ